MRNAATGIVLGVNAILPEPSPARALEVKMHYLPGDCPKSIVGTDNIIVQDIHPTDHLRVFTDPVKRGTSMHHIANIIQISQTFG